MLSLVNKGSQSGVFYTWTMSDSEEIQDNNSDKSDEECSLSLSCASSEFVDDFDEADNELLGVLPCCDIVDTPLTRRITPVPKYRGAILP